MSYTAPHVTVGTRLDGMVTLDVRASGGTGEPFFTLTTNPADARAPADLLWQAAFLAEQRQGPATDE